MMTEELDKTMTERQSVYGDPLTNFTRIANLINVQLEGLFIRPLTALDVAQIQICIKMGRLIQTPTHADSIHDIAGYAKCWQTIVRGAKC